MTLLLSAMPTAASALVHGRIGWVAALLLGWTGALAHQGSSSYLSITVELANVTGQWDMSLIDLDQVVGLDSEHDSDINWAEVKAKQNEIEGYAQARLRLKMDGAVQRLKTVEMLREDFSDGAYAVLRFSVDTSGPPRNLEVDYRAFFDIDRLHRGLFRLEHAGTVQTAIFSPE